MTARDVASALVGIHVGSLWDPRKVVAVPNSNGLLAWEADMLILHPSDWLWEVEIKISAADFRREFKADTKMRKHEALRTGVPRYSWQDTYVQKFFFAMPQEVFSVVKDEVPDYAGIIIVHPSDRPKRFPVAQIERAAKILPNVLKVPPEFRSKMLLSAYYRFWSTAFRNPDVLAEAR